MSFGKEPFTRTTAGFRSSNKLAGILRMHSPPSVSVKKPSNNVISQLRSRANAAEAKMNAQRLVIAELERKLSEQTYILSSRESNNRTRTVIITALEQAKNAAEKAAREAINARTAALQAANNAISKYESEKVLTQQLSKTSEATSAQKANLQTKLAGIERNLTFEREQKNTLKSQINNLESTLDQLETIATEEIAKRNTEIASLALKIQQANAFGSSATANRNRLKKLLEQVKLEATKYMNNANKNRNTALAEAASAKNAAEKAAANRNAKIADIRRIAAATRLQAAFRLKKQIENVKSEEVAKRITQSAINFAKLKNAQNKEAAAVARANAASANSAAQKNALEVAERAHQEQLNALNRARQTAQANRNKALAAKQAAEAAKAAGNTVLAKQKENYARQLQNLAARHTAELSDATKRANAIQRNYHAALSSIETTRGKQTELSATIKSKNTEIARLLALIQSQNTMRLQRNAEMANLQRKERTATAAARAASENSARQRNELQTAKKAHIELIRLQEEQLRQTRIEKTEANAALAKAKRNTEAATKRAEEANQQAASLRTNAAAKAAAKAAVNAEIAKAREELAVAQSKAAAASLAVENAEMRGSASNAARQAANEARTRVQLELENLKKVYDKTDKERKKAIENLATVTQEINSLRFKSAANIQQLQRAMQAAQNSTTTAQKANANRRVEAAKKSLKDSRRTFRQQIKNLKLQLANAKRTGQPPVIVQQFASTLAQAEKQNRTTYKNMASAELVRQIRKLLNVKGPVTPPPPLPPKPSDIARAKRNFMYQLIDNLNSRKITTNNIRQRLQKSEFNKMIENLSELEKAHPKFRTYGNRMNKILTSDIDIDFYDVHSLDRLT